MTGTVYIDAESTHYFTDYLAVSDSDGGWFGNKADGKGASKVMAGVYKQSVAGDVKGLPNREPVKSRMVVEVVRNVDVEPKYKSVYIGTHQ